MGSVLGLLFFLFGQFKKKMEALGVLPRTDKVGGTEIVLSKDKERKIQPLSSFLIAVFLARVQIK